jgi:hypothetical protein
MLGSRPTPQTRGVEPLFQRPAADDAPPRQPLPRGRADSDERTTAAAIAVRWRAGGRVVKGGEGFGHGMAPLNLFDGLYTYVETKATW